MSVLDTCRYFLSVGGVSIIIPSDPPIAGESYTLECSTGGSQADSFQWLGPPDGRTPVVGNSPRLTISSASTSSQLQFRPVQQSDIGSYSCSATVGGLTLASEPVAITVNGNVNNLKESCIHFHSLSIYTAPPISIQIGDGGVTPTAGENYQLTCSVSGAENLSPTITYRWTKNSGSGQTQVGIGSIKHSLLHSIETVRCF